MVAKKTFNKSTSLGHKEHYLEHLRKSSSFKSMTPSERQECVVKFVASTSSSFRFVEDRHFKSRTETNYSRETVSKRAREMSAKQKLALVSRIRDVDSISLTMDIWTCIAVKPSVCITGHYSNTNGVMSTELLNLGLNPLHHLGHIPV